MPPLQRWSGFPAEYRREEIREILHWITLGESGAVVGPSGTGKSNIAGYLATRPEIHAAHLPVPQSDYLFLLLDLNRPAGTSSLNFYLGMLQAIREEVGDEIDIQAMIAAAFAIPDNRYTTFMLYQALEEVHQILIETMDKHVIWVLDRFDSACSKLEAETLNSLRSLRDRHKGALSFIAFTRRPLAQLRAPSDYDEFHELMIMHTCWAGAMTQRDSRWVASQIMERHQCTLADEEIDHLYAICGGWPAFLKLAYTMLAEGKLAGEEGEALIQRLLAEPAIYRSCQKLWDSHTKAERDVLLSIALCETNTECEDPLVDERICAELEQYYLLRRVKNQWRFAALLFAAYVRTQSIDAVRGMRIVNGIVYRNGQTLAKEKSLAPLEYKLLACFLGEAGYVEGSSRVFSHDELIMAVWMDDSRTEIDLSNLIRNLRKKINHDGHDYICNLRGRGYQFVQPE